MLWQDFGNRWEPWRDLNRLQEEVDRLFTGARTRAPREFPPVNVWKGDEGLLVTAEVPGLSPEDIEVSVIHDTLTLKGTRKPEQLGEKERYHRRERGYGDFVRTLQLPYKVNTEKVDARFSKGVLQVSLPRAEEDKPKRISVHSG